MGGSVAGMKQESVGKTAWRGWACAVTLLMLALGAVEDGYGRTDAGDLLGSDAVQYLDCARAMDRSDLHAALNPLWNQGYPALLAVVRPLFGGAMAGEWWTTRLVNFGIFCFAMACFAYLLQGLSRRRDGVFWLCGAAVFTAVEICLGHVSRVNPDQLVAALFLLACAVMVRLVSRGTLGLALGFGLVLGLGFLVKSVFLPLGCGMMAVLAMAVWRGARRWRVIVPAGAVFAVIVLGYGAALSREVGYRTLGESGALNYAWRVNRLTKWVHWEGEVQTADAAWPKPWMARWVRWESDPPQFGQPIHPSVVEGKNPTVYVFHEAVKATYIPYYDLVYWYRGYRPVFRWRYQVIALGRSLFDLARVLAVQPLVYGVVWAVCLLGWPRRKELSPLVVCAALGIVIYLPVYLEGRYINGFLAVLMMAGLAGLEGASAEKRRAVLALVLAGSGLQIVLGQHVEWGRAVHGWRYQDNEQWKVAQELGQSGVRAGDEVGMISWTPNLQCDWAYLAGVQITSEIANGSDERTLWGMSPSSREEVLGRFHIAGARAVLSWEGPPLGQRAGWRRLGTSSMWMYRFQ